MQTQLQLEQALANYFQQVAQLEYASGGPIMSDTGLLEGREG